MVTGAAHPTVLLGQGFDENFESFSPLLWAAGEVKDLPHNELTLPWTIILGRHNSQLRQWPGEPVGKKGTIT